MTESPLTDRKYEAQYDMNIDEMVSALAEQVNVHGELHLDKERTKVLLQFLDFVSKTLTKYDRISRSLKRMVTPI